jgi:hypothetical protein
MSIQDRLTARRSLPVVKIALGVLAILALVSDETLKL